MKKESNRTSLTREELYELVWAKPVIKIAKEFGISDVAVAKACRRHKIPLPGRGYWRRVETGHKATRQPLPKAENRRGNMVIFAPTTANLTKRPPNEQLSKITVPEEPDELHVLARQTLVRLTKKEVDDRHLIVPEDTLDIRVSSQQLSRAVRIMDALIKTLEELGHKVEIKCYRENRGYGYEQQRATLYKTEASIKDAVFGFGIEESVKRLPHIPTKSEEREIARGNKWKVPEYDYVPTGNLSFKIKDDYLYGLRGVWSEGKRHRLEDLVGSFIQGLITAVDSKIERELERECERKRQEEAERRRREKEERRLQEEAHVARLKTEITTWRLVQNAREYVNELEKTMLEHPNPEIEEWIRWIHSYVDRADPFNRSFEG